MSIYLTLLLMALLVGMLILFPLWLKQADRPLGSGQEINQEVSDWLTLKNQLTQQLGALDLALRDNKIDLSTYEVEKQQLLLEADQALTYLQHTRSTNHHFDNEHVQRTYPVFGMICGSVFLMSTIGLSAFLGQQSFNRNISPHANRQIPLPAKTTAMEKPSVLEDIKKMSPHMDKKMPSPHGEKKGKAGILGSDEKPDIQAMVARLEAKVEKPNAPLKDVLMLARSYRVLGKKEESIKLYQRAITLAPNNPMVLLTSGQYMSQSDDKAIQLKGEALFDRLLASRPNFPEAMWLKSLSLVKRHEVAEAKDLLTKLTPLVTNNPQAKKAVAQLLATLNNMRGKP